MPAGCAEAGIERARQPVDGSVGDGQKPGVDRSSVLRLVLHANPMLWPLAICSMVTLGYVLERFARAAARTGDPARVRRAVPRAAVERQARPRASARAVPGTREPGGAGLRAGGQRLGAAGRDHPADRQSRRRRRGRRAQAQSPGLERDVDLGPLLGLLGTVVGIIQSFDALGGRVGPARGEALAHGISLALVATAFGLAIAIVAVAFYYFFLNRVDLLVRELDDRTRQVIELVSERVASSAAGGSAPRSARRRPTRTVRSRA